MMCGGSFCVWSILVAAAFLVSGLALSVFASQIHLSQRERQCISRVQYMLTESHKGLSLWESWQSHRL